MPDKGPTGKTSSSPAEVSPKSDSAAPLPAVDEAELRIYLNRLKSSYEAEDLRELKNMAVLSTMEEIIRQIFSLYRKIKVQMVDLTIGREEIRGTLRILLMENQKGNRVVPAMRWSDQPWTIKPTDRGWKPVLFSPSKTSGADFVAPAIIHDLPNYVARPGKETEIMAVIMDNIAVKEAILHYRPQGTPRYDSIRMVEGQGGRFVAVIPGSMARGTSIEYFLEARDSEGNRSFDGRDERPWAIAVLQNEEPRPN